MQHIFVWEQSLPNNYPSQANPHVKEIGASVVIIAPTLKVAIEQLKKKIIPGDKFGPSAHYQQMVEAMATTKPTKYIPITLPGGNGEPQVLSVSIGAHYNDPQPPSTT
ncbi:MAG: hypothetical protein U0103_24350 [Candidatus Obscuribacterales bacterium]